MLIRIFCISWPRPIGESCDGDQTSVTWWTTCTMSVLSLARSNFGELCPNPRSWSWTGSPQLTPGRSCLALVSSLLSFLFLLSALVASHEKLQPSIWRASEHQKILCNVKTLWETIIWKENLTHFLLCACDTHTHDYWLLKKHFFQRLYVNFVFERIWVAKLWLFTFKSTNWGLRLCC